MKENEELYGYGCIWIYTCVYNVEKWCVCVYLVITFRKDPPSRNFLFKLQTYLHVNAPSYVEITQFFRCVTTLLLLLLLVVLWHLVERYDDRGWGKWKEIERAEERKTTKKTQCIQTWWRLSASIICLSKLYYNIICIVDRMSSKRMRNFDFVCLQINAFATLIKTSLCGYILIKSYSSCLVVTIRSRFYLLSRCAAK